MDTAPMILTPDTWYPSAMAINDRRGTVLMSWSGGRTREFYVRGAVAWPRAVGNSIEGYAVVCGQDLNTLKVMVLDETRFACVSHLVHPTKGIRVQGVGPWLTRAFTVFGCRRYFYCDTEGVHDRYARDCRNCGMLEPKPYWREVNIGPTERAADVIIEQVGGAGLVYRRGADLGIDAGLRQFSAQRSAVDLVREPALYALTTALHGLAHHPWRNPLATTTIDGV